MIICLKFLNPLRKLNKNFKQGVLDKYEFQKVTQTSREKRASFQLSNHFKDFPHKQSWKEDLEFPLKCIPNILLQPTTPKHNIFWASQTPSNILLHVHTSQTTFGQLIFRPILLQKYTRWKWHKEK